MFRISPAIFAALAIAATPGCVAQGRVDLGAMTPFAGRAAQGSTARAHDPVVALEAAGGLGAGDDNGGFGIETRFRSKFGRDVTSASVNTGLFAVGGSPNAKSWFFTGSLGAALGGVVYTAEKASVDVGSPYLQLGIGRRISEDAVLTGTASVEYAIRVGDAPNTGYVGILLGYGDVTYRHW